MLLRKTWEVLNSKFVVSVLASAAFAFSSWGYARWAEHAKAEGARVQRAAALRIELEERAGDLCQFTTTGGTDDDLRHVEDVFVARNAKSRPEFQDVSTWALYAEWCQLDPAYCKVTPADLRVALRNVRAHWFRTRTHEQDAAFDLAASVRNTRTDFLVVRRAVCSVVAAVLLD